MDEIDGLFNENLSFGGIQSGMAKNIYKKENVNLCH